MDIDGMVPSKSNFLKKEDVGTEGRDLTIKSFYREEIKNQEGGFDLKYCIVWTDDKFKPMVLNKENASRLKMCFKTSDTDQMIGGTVNVYFDEFVSFGGKQVGGIRIRPSQRRASPTPRRAAAPAQDDGPPTPPAEAYNDDISHIGR